MDCRNELPPIQEGKIIYNNTFSAFGLSLQGASHVNADPPVPCQDYNNLIYLENADILIAAIADGVGSCSLSHWGAYKAVRAVLGSMKTGLEAISGGRKLILTPDRNAEIKELLFNAFASAREAVEELADDAGELTTNFQSTLTAVIYDGQNLLYGHVGDDGIVVQAEDGTVQMATRRLKGEEASSVYPLQSGEKAWQFGRVDRPIAGFFMATDGVLDAFVATREDFFKLNYNNGVNYAFMEEGIYTLAENSRDAVQNALTSYKNYMLSETYRATVTDDLTLVTVVSNRLIATGQHPTFSIKLFRTIQQESSRYKRLLLDHREIPIARLDGNKESDDEEPADPPVSAPRRAPISRQSPVPRPTPTPQPVPTPRPAPSPRPNPKKPQKKGMLAKVVETVVLFLVILLAAAILLCMGMLIDRTYFLPVSHEEYEAVEQSRDDYAKANEALNESYADLTEKTAGLEQALQDAQEANDALEENNQSLTQKIQKLEQALQQSRAEATDASAQRPDQKK